MKSRKKRNTTTTKGKRTFTVKCTLSRIKPHRKLRHAINDTVNDLHKVYTAGTLLAQTVLYKAFHDNTLHMLPTIDQTFFIPVAGKSTLLFNMLNGSSRPEALRRPVSGPETTTSLQIKAVNAK